MRQERHRCGCARALQSALARGLAAPHSESAGVGERRGTMHAAGRPGCSTVTTVTEMSAHRLHAARRCRCPAPSGTAGARVPPSPLAWHGRPGRLGSQRRSQPPPATTCCMRWLSASPQPSAEQRGARAAHFTGRRPCKRGSRAARGRQVPLSEAREGRTGEARDLLAAALRGGRREQAGRLVAQRAGHPQAARAVAHGLRARAPGAAPASALPSSAGAGRRPCHLRYKVAMKRPVSAAAHNLKPTPGWARKSGLL